MTMSADSVLRSSLDSLPRTLFTTYNTVDDRVQRVKTHRPGGQKVPTWPRNEVVTPGAALLVLHFASRLSDYRT